MKFSNPVRLLLLTILIILVIPTFVQTSPTQNADPVMMSYNPAPANRFHAPLSTMAVVAITNSTPSVQNQTPSTSQDNRSTTLKTIKQNSLRFLTDNTYFPQSETTIAVDPNNPNHVVGGFNDDKFFFCPLLPQDCGNTLVASISGFTTSIDGGQTVAKSNHLPGVNASSFGFSTQLVSWGDPSIASSIDGNFFYASLAIDPVGPIFGNGIMIAKSNNNLFDPNVSCATTIENPVSNPCWKAVFVNGNTNFPVFTFEDKDRITVDRDPSSQYYGSVYIGWDHFNPIGTSSSYLARCDNNLAKCTMLSRGRSVLSGGDPFVAWTTPVVDKNGNVHVAWCNFGTFITFGPVSCRVASSPPGGNSFSAPNDIFSYMGIGTTLPADTVIIGWATEQFRTAVGIISLASDTSSKSDNLYFTTQVCTSGHFYRFPYFIFPAADNPGDCGTSAVLIATSTDSGTTWTNPATLSDPAVNDQAFVTVDPQTGTVYVVYYTTQYDPFNHRIDVVASVSNNAGSNFHQQRITSVSDEPNSDPNMYNYLVPNGFGGSFTSPQYGDYFEATATRGTLWVLFTGNYAVEAGTFQTDPFLAVIGRNSQSIQSISV